MLNIDTSILFFASSLALALAPGPDNIFVLTQSALYGRFAGILVTAGLCTGLLFHTAAVALGVAVVLQNSDLAFNALKVAGALYLAYLAWKSFTAQPDSISAAGQGGQTSRSLYLRGIVMNITNPKVALFFLAFLPQFVNAGVTPVHWQVIALGALFMLATLLVFGLIAVFAGMLSDWLKRSDVAQRIIHRLAGVVLLSLALRLLFSQQ